MEARPIKVLIILVLPALLGAGYRADNPYRTDNFSVTAPTPEIAKQVGQAAEHYRKQLAIDWLGYELPRWFAPCPIQVTVGQIGAGGATTFSFYPNGRGSAEVCNWDMRIQGSLERILDSVLPHEISHTIFACHFRRPLPRWADEGAATLAEHESERRRQVLTVRQVVGGRRRIPLRNLLSIKEYPVDPQDVLTLYAEGYALAELLVQEGGRERYLKFLGDAHAAGWEKAIRTHYSYGGIEDLEKRWHDWIVAGSPEIAMPKDQELASSGSKLLPAEKAPILRAQSPSDDPFLENATAAPAKAALPITVTSPAPRERPKQKLARAEAEGPVAAEEGHERVVRESSNCRGDAAPRESSTKIGSSSKIDLAAEKRTRSAAATKLAVQRTETASSAARRQVTEWSEFPQDPRPSPFRLPGGNRSGERP